jgi:hypothetical protein
MTHLLGVDFFDQVNLKRTLFIILKTSQFILKSAEINSFARHYLMTLWTSFTPLPPHATIYAGLLGIEKITLRIVSNK